MKKHDDEFPLVLPGHPRAREAPVRRGRDGLADAGRLAGAVDARPASTCGRGASRRPSPGSGSVPATASATLMWNHDTHLAAYFGVPSPGGSSTRSTSGCTPRNRVHRQPRRAIASSSSTTCSSPSTRSSRRWRLRAVIVCPSTGAPVPEPYESLVGPPRVDDGGLPVSAHRRERPARHLLHVRNDRQAQGRRLLAPLDRPALVRGHDGRRARAVDARHGAAGGPACSTSTRGDPFASVMCRGQARHAGAHARRRRACSTSWKTRGSRSPPVYPPCGWRSSKRSTRNRSATSSSRGYAWSSAGRRRRSR